MLVYELAIQDILSTKLSLQKFFLSILMKVVGK